MVDTGFDHAVQSRSSWPTVTTTIHTWVALVSDVAGIFSVTDVNRMGQ